MDAPWHWDGHGLAAGGGQRGCRHMEEARPPTITPSVKAPSHIPNSSFFFFFRIVLWAVTQAPRDSPILQHTQKLDSQHHLAELEHVHPPQRTPPFTGTPTAPPVLSDHCLHSGSTHVARKLMMYLGASVPLLWASPWGCLGVLIVAGGTVTSFPTVRCPREHGEAAMTFGSSSGKAIQASPDLGSGALSGASH